MPELTIRLLQPEDSLEEITLLLNRAYQRLADLGFNYTAVDQTVEVTRSRIKSCECYVAMLDGRLVGTVNLELNGREKPDWMQGRKDAAYASQLGVDPEARHLGIGSKLMDAAEDHARKAGFSCIAGDTSEGARYLLDFYGRRGYEVLDHHQWPGKSYRSVVLVKQL